MRLSLSLFPRIIPDCDVVFSTSSFLPLLRHIFIRQRRDSFLKYCARTHLVRLGKLYSMMYLLDSSIYKRSRCHDRYSFCWTKEDKGALHVGARGSIKAQGSGCHSKLSFIPRSSTANTTRHSVHVYDEQPAVKLLISSGLKNTQAGLCKLL